MGSPVVEVVVESPKFTLAAFVDNVTYYGDPDHTASPVAGQYRGL